MNRCAPWKARHVIESVQNLNFRLVILATYKVDIFWEHQNFLQNLHLRIIICSLLQIYQPIRWHHLMWGTNQERAKLWQILTGNKTSHYWSQSEILKWIALRGQLVDSIQQTFVWLDSQHFGPNMIWDQETEIVELSMTICH